MTKSSTQDSNQARIPLSVLVSSSTFKKLVELSEEQGLTRRAMLNRILNHAVPKTTFNQVTKDFKYKGTKGDKQINYMINSSAWYKLESFKANAGKSKARIVQSLINNYQPTKV